MKAIPLALQARLAAGVITLCNCWKLTRTDGVVLGFTDHDEDITFDGVTYRAATGFTPADAERALGLAAGQTELAGALSAAAINEEDITAGRYDGAEVEWWLVDWEDPANRVRMGAGQLGQVRRGELHFEAELRTLAARLNEVRGRVFSHMCDAELGDARCGVNLNDAAFRGTGTVDAVHGAAVHLSGLSGFAEGFFTHGHVEVTTGAATGFHAVVLAHRLQGGLTVLTLGRQPPETLAAGDGVLSVAGCDRSFVTCHDKFGNTVNFRGFPHMPGNDFVISYPTQGDDNLDGGSMNE